MRWCGHYRSASSQGLPLSLWVSIGVGRLRFLKVKFLDDFRFGMVRGGADWILLSYKISLALIFLKLHSNVIGVREINIVICNSRNLLRFFNGCI